MKHYLQVVLFGNYLIGDMTFIKGYADIIASMENLLKKDVKFQWNEECQKSLDILKEKIVSEPILVSLN